MPEATTDWVTCGSQRARIDGDTLLVHYAGLVTAEDSRQVFGLAEQIIAVHGYVYIIGDVEHVSAMNAEARREFVQWAKSHPVRGFANVKAKLMTRTLGTLIQNALRLVTGSHYPNTFVDDEASARRWIAEQERKRAAAPKPL